MVVCGLQRVMEPRLRLGRSSHAIPSCLVSDRWRSALAEIEKDMQLTESEFLRLMPAAMQGRDFTLAAGRVSASGINITYSALPNRVLGALSLPRLLVTLDVNGLDREDKEAFMRKFDLTFMRGGG